MSLSSAAVLRGVAKASPDTVIFHQDKTLAGTPAQQEDDMNGNFRNVWVELAFQQVCSYRLATAVVAKSVETCWMVGPQMLGDGCLPRSDEPLNPLEFHGKRRSERTPLIALWSTPKSS